MLQTAYNLPSCSAPMVGTKPTVVDESKDLRTDRKLSIVRCNTREARDRAEGATADISIVL